MDADAVCCSWLALRNAHACSLVSVASQGGARITMLTGVARAAAAATEASEGADTYDMVMDGMSAAMAMLGGGAGAPAAAEQAGPTAAERRLAAKREKLLQQVQVHILGWEDWGLVGIRTHFWAAGFA